MKQSCGLVITQYYKSPLSMSMITENDLLLISHFPVGILFVLQTLNWIEIPFRYDITFLYKSFVFYNIMIIYYCTSLIFYNFFFSPFFHSNRFTLSIIVYRPKRTYHNSRSTTAPVAGRLTRSTRWTVLRLPVPNWTRNR